MTFWRRAASTLQPPGLILAAGFAAGCQAERPLDEATARPRPAARPALVATAEPPAEPSSAPAPQAGMDAHREPAPAGAGGGSQISSPSPAARGKVRFAVLGDYGRSGSAEQQVAELVDTVKPDFVITTGDNNYPSGSAATIDENIGQYFSELIYPYRGSYASSATENRFFPTLGNHDWVTEGAQPYLDYFTLPGNERYYDIVRGDVHFFAIDSDVREPDGIDADSAQAQWLRQGLASSRAAFQVVAMHHPPYSSGPHGNSEALQWPYGEWGADVVFAGHDHCYERLEVAGTTYVVSGLGGASIYTFGLPVEGSLVRYNDQYGIVVFDADAHELSLSFFNIDGLVIDSTRISRPQ